MLAVWLIIYPVKEEVFPVTFPSIQFEFLNGFLINKVSSITPMINQGIWARKKWTLGSWDAFSKIFLVNIWYTIVIYSCDANTEFIKPLLQSSVTHDPWIHDPIFFCYFLISLLILYINIIPCIYYGYWKKYWGQRYCERLLDCRRCFC